MKVGDYVRTKDGHIEKIIDKYKATYGYKIVVNEDFKFKHYEHNYIKHIIKSSPNIIDLIEEGDILKVNDFKDVYTIYEVEMFRNPYTNEKYLGIRNDFSKRPKRLYEIPLVNLSIVTKEQFKSIEYKVKE